MYLDNVIIQIDAEATKQIVERVLEVLDVGLHARYHPHRKATKRILNSKKLTEPEMSANLASHFPLKQSLAVILPRRMISHKSSQYLRLRSNNNTTSWNSESLEELYFSDFTCSS